MCERGRKKAPFPLPDPSGRRTRSASSCLPQTPDPDPCRLNRGSRAQCASATRGEGGGREEEGGRRQWHARSCARASDVGEAAAAARSGGRLRPVPLHHAERSCSHATRGERVEQTAGAWGGQPTSRRLLAPDRSGGSTGGACSRAFPSASSLPTLPHAHTWDVCAPCGSAGGAAHSPMASARRGKRRNDGRVERPRERRRGQRPLRILLALLFATPGARPGARATRHVRPRLTHTLPACNWPHTTRDTPHLLSPHVLPAAPRPR